ncbi:MAG: cupredoxin domain-containing protein [Actinomycetota bacterium]
MLGFISSEKVVIGVVVGIPLIAMALVVVATRPRLPGPVVAASMVVGAVLVAVALWAVFRPGANNVASGAKLAGLPADVPNATPTAALTSQPPAATEPPAPACSPSGTTVTVIAQAIAFDKACLAAPADTAFRVTLDNEDAGIPHNVTIYRDASASERLGGAEGAGDFVTGPEEVTYDVPALAAGSYFFRCDLHPAQMTGTFVVA